MQEKYTIQPPKGIALWHQLKELVAYRELIYFISWRNIKVKYKEATFGVLWAIFKPLFFMIVLVFVVRKGMNMPSDDIPAPLFFMIGVLFWFFFRGIVGSCSTSTLTDSNLYKRVYFPKLALPISVVISELFDFFLASSVFFAMVIWYLVQGMDMNVWQVIGTYLLSMILTVTGGFGVGVLVAALNVKYRDIQHMIPFILRTMFFVTPIMYPVSLFNEIPWAGKLLALNPMTGALALARSPFSSIPIDPLLLSISLVSTIVITIIGVLVFFKQEKYFADIA